MKIKQMSEEQAKEIICILKCQSISKCIHNRNCMAMDEGITFLKAASYIKQSVLEEAREIREKIYYPHHSNEDKAVKDQSILVFNLYEQHIKELEDK